MTDQYEELPECKSVDEFKEGETVRVYAHRVPGIYEIKTILGDELYLSVPNGPIEGAPWHFKCCRKLKKREPRVFWINKYCIDSDFDLMIKAASITSKNPGSLNFIKVQEID